MLSRNSNVRKNGSPIPSSLLTIYGYSAIRFDHCGSFWLKEVYRSFKMSIDPLLMIYQIFSSLHIHTQAHTHTYIHTSHTHVRKLISLHTDVCEKIRTAKLN